jgi:tRNA-2-methylthio-N6-dimethylallyladenosine synthase
MNYSDSERIASFLEAQRFKPTDNIKSADLVIFNTCGVRQMAEDRAYGQIHNLNKLKPTPNIILTGCLAERKDVQKRLKNKVDLFCAIKEFPQTVESIMYKAESKKIHPAYTNEKINYLSIKPKHTNDHEAFVPVMTGCNNFCSYCVVPYARGREVSRPAEEVLAEVKALIKKGYKMITLLGQNVNSYEDKKINFPKLLKKINALPGNFWITFLTSHPKDVSDELIEVVTKSKKVCEAVHFPIQAGDDEILKKMNRKYTSAHYLKLVAKIKKSFAKNKPNTLYSVAGDIIVGFPSETRKQFLKSAKIMEKVGYDMIYFGQFSPRFGTVAAKMKDNVSKKEKVRRENFLNEILKITALANNQKYLGRTLDVLVESEKNRFYFGKTRTMKNIKLPADKKGLTGNIIKIKITRANIWNLEGEAL